jgi:hypothetical protein
MKKAPSLVLLLALALLCARAQATDTSVVAPLGSKEGAAAKSKMKKSTGNGNKVANRSKPFKMAPVVVKAARIVPERLQTHKEARKSLDQTPRGGGSGDSGSY